MTGMVAGLCPCRTIPIQSESSEDAFGSVRATLAFNTGLAANIPGVASQLFSDPASRRERGHETTPARAPVCLGMILSSKVLPQPGSD